MHRKWLGWKKVAVCLVGAAMIMQGASLAMAAEENPTTNQESSAAEENDQDTSSEETDETEKDAQQSNEEQINVFVTNTPVVMNKICSEYLEKFI